LPFNVIFLGKNSQGNTIKQAFCELLNPLIKVNTEMHYLGVRLSYQLPS